ncbi:hypothetical protein [Clostridium intestinale]|jgi:hypothetical protein|uniref:hypothetical protein n=1 Tax=Clostridium intestinale TaxID=36845 RepID=UPI0004214B31|nr:hypothetical protein [Clostridium intestinale]
MNWGNQANGSRIGGTVTCLATTEDAPPINFRVKNLSGFTIGDIRYLDICKIVKSSAKIC